MLNMYTFTNKVPNGMRIVRSNDVEFIYTGAIIPNIDIVKKALKEVEGAEYVDEFGFIGKFSEYAVDSKNLSTGCKTIINIINAPDSCFFAVECGGNALDFIYKYLDGNILIPHYDTFDYTDGRDYSIDGVVIKSYAEYRRVFEDAINK